MKKKSIEPPLLPTVTQVALVKAKLNTKLDQPFFDTAERFQSLIARRCDHREHGFVLDKTDRTATCKGCKREIDPFEALLAYAHSESRLVNTLHQIQQHQESEAKQKARAKERVAFGRKVVSAVDRKDMSLKAEPVIGHAITLDCGHTFEVPLNSIPKIKTCSECEKRAKTAIKRR